MIEFELYKNGSMNKTLTFYWMQQFTWKWFYDDLHTFVLLVFHERDLLCARMITGILEPFGHYLILRHPFCHFVTKHCLFSLPSPLNFLWSAALSPALCSTGSKLLFLCKSLILVNKSRLCLFSPSMFITCGRCLFVSLMSWNAVCSPSF